MRLRIRSKTDIDAVPVVRCKDCINYRCDRKFFDYDFCRIHYYCDGTPIEVNGKEFCSRGERRINTDD